MLTYLARRLAFAVATVLAASVVSFLLVHASGSSPGAITAGAGATPAQVAAENHRLGWDQPLVTQYLTWLGHAASGNLGVSLIDGHDIWSDLMSRLPVTASIAVFATLLSGVFGVAHRRRRRGPRRPRSTGRSPSAAAWRCRCPSSGSASCSST